MGCGISLQFWMWTQILKWSTLYWKWQSHTQHIKYALAEIRLYLNYSLAEKSWRVKESLYILFTAFCFLNFCSYQYSRQRRLWFIFWTLRWFQTFLPKFWMHYEIHVWSVFEFIFFSQCWPTLTTESLCYHWSTTHAAEQRIRCCPSIDIWCLVKYRITIKGRSYCKIITFCYHRNVLWYVKMGIYSSLSLVWGNQVYVHKMSFVGLFIVLLQQLFVIWSAFVVCMYIIGSSSHIHFMCRLLD